MDLGEGWFRIKSHKNDAFRRYIVSLNHKAFDMTYNIISRN